MQDLGQAPTPIRGDHRHSPQQSESAFQGLLPKAPLSPPTGRAEPQGSHLEPPAEGVSAEIQ